MFQVKKNTNSLLTFRYTGKNVLGQKISGAIRARNLTLAKIDLRKQGITISKVAQKRNLIIFNQLNKKPSSADIALFSRQLATMVESGIPLMHALDIVAKGQINPHLQELINEIKHDIGAGLTLSETLMKHSQYFNSLFCNLVKAGEQSGTLDIMLNKIACYKEKIESIKKKIKKAVSYPIAIVSVAVIVTVGLLMFVVPQFETLFQSFGADLPTLTLAVVKISQYIQSCWYCIFSSLALSIYAFIYAQKHSTAFAITVDKLLLKIPVIGPIIEKTVIARFSRTLSITFAAGLPLVDGLKSAAGATGNIMYANAIEYIKNEVFTGISMNKAMENTHLFPNMVMQMIAIGEESGALEKMLSKIADFYEEDVDNSVDALSRLLEPIIMSIIGILVGGLIVAMYMPLFKLGAVI
ncbi:type II secretion system F family protein [Legionella lytica]|uniref:Type II secretion system F family protein n=1 Tax=Legionella lytica TaxID=96232 RepID=A0ABY4Y6D8_9GAMM|nr:type II secretion system F family protein [Legionella lytica]USQ12800.1 type II secretion system F family protein [Legionella lytica]